MRPWYRIHRSTLSVLLIVLACLVFINLPGKPLGDKHSYYHGWPYFYFERKVQPRTWWSFSGTATVFHVDALVLNVVAALCITALAACATELWIRRYGSLFRFSIKAVLVVTGLIAVFLGIAVRDLHRCLRQQETLDRLAAQGSLSVSREERDLDWLRGLFGSNLDGAVESITFRSTSRQGATLPDLSALVDLEWLYLDGIALGAEDIQRFQSLPKLQTLYVSVKSLRDELSATLTPLSEHPELAGLILDGDDFGDEAILQLSDECRIHALRINSALITADSLKHISRLKSLDHLQIEQTPLRDADFSPLAQAPSLRFAMFVGCNLSAADEAELMKLGPDGNVATGNDPVSQSKFVQAFRIEQNTSDSGPGAIP